MVRLYPSRLEILNGYAEAEPCRPCGGQLRLSEFTRGRPQSHPGADAHRGWVAGGRRGRPPHHVASRKRWHARRESVSRPSSRLAASADVRQSPVVGSTIKAFGPTAVRLFAFHPHEGHLARSTGPVIHSVPNLAVFSPERLPPAAVYELVVPIVARATDVRWTRPVVFLFVDGLHHFGSDQR